MLITEQGLSFLPEPLSKSEPEFSRTCAGKVKNGQLRQPWKRVRGPLSLLVVSGSNWIKKLDRRSKVHHLILNFLEVPLFLYMVGYFLKKNYHQSF